ncbi:hypothetical protein JCM8547_008077 [Rhodosporidiobolus lusitaniae]
MNRTTHPSHFPSPQVPPAFVPSHHAHSSSLSSLSSFLPQPPSQFMPSHSPHASLSTNSNSNTTPPYLATQTNHTRVLLLADFNPQLKTKDIQEAFSEWQDEPGGLKVKWRDDTSAWIVFGEPAVAKRAFLSLVTSPPPSLQPSSITPYTGPDVPSILQAVQNRPRSRSIAGGAGQGGAPSTGGGGHSRKGSLLGSGGGSALGAAIASAQAAGPHGAATASSSSSSGGVSPSSEGGPNGSGHARHGSWQRSSISSPLSGMRTSNGGGSPIDGHGGAGGVGNLEGRTSPETPGLMNGGVLAGEAPRRFGGGGLNGTSGHKRRESRSGSDAVAASVAGLTIDE